MNMKRIILSIPKHLRRVAKTVEKYGRRVQYSGFEVQAFAGEMEKLKHRIQGLIDLDEDSVVYFQLYEKDRQKREFFPSN